MKTTPIRTDSATRAFTLLELLVVIGLLGLLSALVVPATQRVLQQSRATQCIGNLKQLGTALGAYLSDHNNVLPVLETARDSVDTDVPVIDNTLDEYVQNHEVFCCKADGIWCKRTGTSYLWNHLINGQSVASLEFMGFIRSSQRIPVIGDKEGFHRFRDVKVNILYADGHVAKEIQFITGEP